MTDFEQTNRLLNRAERVVDELAQELATLPFNAKEQSLRRLAEALELLGKVKKTIIQHDPSLEYHFNDEMPATKYMSEIHSYVAEADRLMESKDFESAISLLKEALKMEPPPIIYEALVKKLDRAESNRQ